MCCIKSYSSVAKIKIPTLVETSWMRRPWPTGGCCAPKRKSYLGAWPYVLFVPTRKCYFASRLTDFSDTYSVYRTSVIWLYIEECVLCSLQLIWELACLIDGPKWTLRASVWIPWRTFMELYAAHLLHERYEVWVLFIFPSSSPINYGRKCIYRPWGPPSLPYNGYRVFPGCKAAGAWCWRPTPI